jgi:ankyrin repeat protein
MDLASIYSSCISGDIKKLKRTCDLLKNEYGHAEFLNENDHHGFLPIDLTVIHGHFDCCQYLFETFNINPTKFNAVGQSAFFYSINLARHKFLKYFIENSKKYLPTRTQEDLLVLFNLNKEQMSSFQVAIESNHPQTEVTLALLIKYMRFTFQLKKKIYIGAVRNGNVMIMEFILERCEEEDDRRELLNLSFNLTSNYMKNISLLSEATTTPLIYAITRRDHQLISFLLSQTLVDVNKSNTPLNDCSPLFAAIELNDIETVILLMEKSVSNLVLINGISPLKYALMMRKDFLRNSEKGAKQNFMIIELLCGSVNDVHLCDEDGTCSFDLAVLLQYTDVIEHFITCQGDLSDRKNKKGKAPIDYAEPEYRKFLKLNLPFKATILARHRASI